MYPPECMSNAVLEGGELVYDFASPTLGTIPDTQQVLNEGSLHKMNDG